jgi:spore coat protein U-like protein
MKKHILSAVAVAALSASAAMAQNQSVEYNLSADVEEICTVNDTAGRTSIDVDFGTLSNVSTSDTVTIGAGGLTYRCNAPGGFQRRIESDNDGFMVRAGTSGGGANQIAFEMQHGGGSGLGTGGFISLNSPVVTNLGGSTAFLSGQTGSVNFRANGVQSGGGTTVFAGDYADTVTVSVTAN